LLKREHRTAKNIATNNAHVAIFNLPVNAATKATNNNIPPAMQRHTNRTRGAYSTAQIPRQNGVANWTRGY
jgi:hypothetical protein